MNRKRLNLIVGILLMLIFVVMLFCFQVRQTEVAIVTTFGKVTRTVTEPGFNLKWPWPIQSVHFLDRRIQSFESPMTEISTTDGRYLLFSVYAGWSIANPRRFFENFGGSVREATRRLEEMIDSRKNATVGRHPFSHFVSTDEKELKFAEVEQELLEQVNQDAGKIYGIEVKFLGIKRIALPGGAGGVTESVFSRMRKERQKLMQKLQAEGESRASEIRSAADRDREKLLAEADAKAKNLMGEAYQQAAQVLETFQKNPDLAILILKLEALEKALNERTTLILDERTPPFDLLKNVSTNRNY
jgi:membrane protease subunit HflC